MENTDTLSKWVKVRDALKAAGKTDSPFYQRAEAYIRTGRDPGASSDGKLQVEFRK